MYLKIQWSGVCRTLPDSVGECKVLGRSPLLGPSRLVLVRDGLLLLSPRWFCSQNSASKRRLSTAIEVIYFCRICDLFPTNACARNSWSHHKGQAWKAEGIRWHSSKFMDFNLNKAHGMTHQNTSGVGCARKPKNMYRLRTEHLQSQKQRRSHSLHQQDRASTCMEERQMSSWFNRAIEIWV